jgi:hypothetical protein
MSVTVWLPKPTGESEELSVGDGVSIDLSLIQQDVIKIKDANDKTVAAFTKSMIYGACVDQPGPSSSTDNFASFSESRCGASASSMPKDHALGRPTRPTT